MSSLSQYKGLVLPEKKEKYNLDIVNENNKKIDEELHNLEVKNQEQDNTLATKDEVNAQIKSLQSAIDTKVDQTDLESHTSDEQVHITKEEREKWNNASLGMQIDGETVYLDCQDGKYGINTDPERGADTFCPFKSEGENNNKNEDNFEYPFVIRLTSGSSNSSEFTSRATSRFKAITYINIRQPKKIILQSGSFIGVRANASGTYSINIYAKNNEESETIIKSYSCSGGSSLKNYETTYNENQEISIEDNIICITKFEVVKSAVSSDDTKIFNPFYDMIFEIYY